MNAKRVSIAELLQWSAVTVIRFRNQWKVGTIGMDTSGVFGDPLSTLTTHPQYQHQPFTLIFASGSELTRFLGDTSQADEEIRSVVRIARHYGSPLVMTKRELFSQLPDVRHPEVKGHWALDLRTTDVLLENPYAPVPIMGVDLFDWNFKAVATNDNAEFQFCRQLSYRWAVNRILRRRPQSLLEGRDVVISDGRPLASVDARWDHLVVPHSPIMPVTVSRRALEFWMPADGKAYAATVYAMPDPQVRCALPSPSSRHLQRETPVDVLSAASSH